MNLNALSSQAVKLLPETATTTTMRLDCGRVRRDAELPRFRVSSPTPFSAPRRRGVVLCGFVIGSAAQFSHCQKLSLQMSLRYCAACHVQGPQVYVTHFFFGKTMHVKICGIRREEDAVLVAELGADAIGLLVGQQHPSPDFISEQSAARIAHVAK